MDEIALSEKVVVTFLPRHFLSLFTKSKVLNYPMFSRGARLLHFPLTILMHSLPRKVTLVSPLMHAVGHNTPTDDMNEKQGL